jgi:predicted metal-dependent hydrolase
MMLSAPLKIERIPRQRGMKLWVLPNSTIILRCSKKESESALQKFLLTNKDWIEKSLKKTQKLQAQNPQLLFSEGESFRILGQKYRFRIEKGAHKGFVYTKGDEIILRTSKNLSHREIREKILEFYFQTAQRIIPNRVQKLSQETGLFPKKISLRKQRTLWGSCTRAGHIQLNWKLISAPLAVLDYVIIHELAHLKHPNHSPRFWSEVEKFCQDHKTLRRWLRKEHYSFDFFNDYSELHSHSL